MYRIILAIVMLVSFSFCLAASHRVSLSAAEDAVRLVEKRAEGLILDLSVPALDIVEVLTTGDVDIAATEGGAFRRDGGRSWTHISADGFTGTGVEGEAQLLYLSRFISVPVGARVDLSIIETNTTEISLGELGFEYAIYPAQPHLKKSQDPRQVAFVYNESSYQRVIETEPVRVNELGFMRGQRIFEVVYQPVQYDPVAKNLRVYDKMQVAIDFVGSDWAETESLLERTFSADFEIHYESHLLNYTPPANRDALLRIPTKYVIICHNNNDFANAMQPFVNWKKQQGFDVIFRRVGDAGVGTTKESIKAYLQGLWDAATPQSPAPTYLLIVGDHGQIPAWPGNVSAWESPADHITDLTYVRLQGADYLGEMYYGRFSANNLTELQPQIDKTLMYEKLTMPDPSYLSKALLIAGHDTWSSTQYCNGQINYMSTQYFNSTHGYPSPYIWLYPTSSQGSNPATIRSQINEGLGWMNYTAHGWHDSWSDPLVNVTHINNSTNVGKYGIAIGNACVTSKFEVYNCFGEAWLRKADGGAVIYIGATNSTSWDPDYRWAVGNVAAPSNGSAVPYNASQLGMYDKLFHKNDEAYEDWYVSAAAMIYGGNLAMQAAGTYNDTMKNMYWEIYCVMGDPSLIPYLGVPATNSVSLPNYFFGQGNYVVTQSAPYARVALSLNNELMAVAIANASGVATLDMSAFTVPCSPTLTITAQNYKPYTTTVQILPAGGAYLIFVSAENAETENEFVPFFEEVDIAVSLKNVGSAAAENVTLTLSSTSSYVEILKPEIVVTNIPVSDNYIVPDTFTIKLDSTIPNLTEISFDLLAEAGAQQWEMDFTLTGTAPIIEMVSIFVNDGDNGSLDPNETAQLAVSIKNTGNAASLQGTATVTSNSPSVEIEIISDEVEPIQPRQTGNFTFNVTADELIFPGTVVDFEVTLDFGYTQVKETFTLIVGERTEDFESGDFDTMNWVNNSPTPWSITSDEAYSGYYSARSGAIGNSRSTVLQINYLVEIDNEISFALKTSTEEDADVLQFLINDDVIGTWSGETEWEVVTFPVVAGEHSFKWRYTKNASGTAGEDTVWIDQIVFPVIGSLTPSGVFAFVPTTSIDFGEVEINETATEKISILNLGDETLTGSFTLPTQYTLDIPANFSVPARQTLIAVVSFSSSEEGNFDGQIVIATNDPQKPEIIINVSADVTETSDNDAITPAVTTRLNGNYPNPFNPSTTISFSVSENQTTNTENRITIDIYNIRGQKVKTLVNGVYPSGTHTAVWNGTDDDNRAVSSGIYLYRMQTEGYAETRRMILLK